MEIRARVQEDGGFTLVEVLVVTLILGILAAIALTQLSDNRAKAQDSEAKMNTGSMHRMVEACFTETEDYRECESGDPGMSDVRMPMGNAAGQTDVTSADPRDYRIQSLSRSGNVFRIIKTDGGRPTRSCSVPPGGKPGGCKNDPAW